MTKTVSHLLHEYGVAKFGDYWTPQRPDNWLDPEDAEKLNELLAKKDAKNPETARLLNKLGVTLFCDKWRPESATHILGEKGAAKVRDFIETELVSAMRM